MADKLAHFSNSLAEEVTFDEEELVGVLDSIVNDAGALRQLSTEQVISFAVLCGAVDEHVRVALETVDARLASLSPDKQTNTNNNNDDDDDGDGNKDDNDDNDDDDDDDDDDDGDRARLRDVRSVLLRQLIDSKNGTGEEEELIEIVDVPGLVENATFTPAFAAAVDGIFARFDVDGDGKWSVAEMSAYYRAVNDAVATDSIIGYFQSFAAGPDGLLTLDGYRYLMLNQSADRDEVLKDLATLGFTL